MAWRYNQTSGCMSDPSGAIVAVGYAGSPEGKNNPAKQDVAMVGPLPQGRYTVGEPSLDHPKLGPLALPLTPHHENQMFGRGGFFIHADSITHPGAASEGCIVMPKHAREMIAASPDKDLEVTA